MFTGIVKGLCKISHLEISKGLLSFAVRFSQDLLADLHYGASVAINGVCLTVVKITDQDVWFDAIQETLDKTNIKGLSLDSLVNVERSMRLGEEVGGHLLSGHVFGEVAIFHRQEFPHYTICIFQCAKEWMKYLHPKGFIALDGASLTIVEVNPIGSQFSVHLIPETLRRTTFGFKKENDLVNIEFETTTQTIVDTLERLQIPRDESILPKIR